MSEKDKGMLESMGSKIGQLPEEMKQKVLERLNDVATGAMMVIEAQANAAEGTWERE